MLDLREQQVLQQVHRVQAHPALVDGLEDFQRAADVGGYLDEHHVVGQITPILLQFGRVVVVVLQIAIQRAVGVDQIFQGAEASDPRCLNACAHSLRVGVQLHQLGHHFARAFVTRLQLQVGAHLAVTVHVAGRDQPGNHLPLRLAVKQMLQCAQQQEEGGQALLAVDHLVMVLLVGRRNQNRADEVFPCRSHIDLLADILQQLMHFLVGPDVLALVVRDDVKALPERFLNAVFVVFDAGHNSQIPFILASVT